MSVEISRGAASSSRDPPRVVARRAEILPLGAQRGTRAQKRANARLRTFGGRTWSYRHLSPYAQFPAR
eukprot:29091-Pelagococcus_subviridis.AAC.4